MRIKPCGFVLTASLVLAVFMTSAALAAEPAAESTLPPVEVVTPTNEAPVKPAKPAKPANATNGAVAAPGPGDGTKTGSNQAIAVLVNDEPVTAYEIEQRRNLASLGSNDIGEYVRKNARARWERLIKNPKLNDEFKKFAMEKGVRSKEEVIAVQKTFLQQKQKALIEDLKREARSSVKKGGKDQALEDLIDERLKLQEAKRLNVLASDDEVEKIIGGMAQRNKMNPDQFAAHMKKSGVDISAMRDRFRAELSWRDVIRRRFGAQVAITERDIERFVSKAPAGDDEVAFDVKRITLPIPSSSDQKTIAMRMQEAEAARGRFGGCKTVAEFANGLAGARLEALGAQKPSAIPEPTRTLLIDAKAEDILPPTVNAQGIELWIVCGRETVKADEQKRAAAQDELRQKEFELLAKRHLKDLRQDAHIEYR